MSPHLALESFSDCSGGINATGKQHKRIWGNLPLLQQFNVMISDAQINQTIADSPKGTETERSIAWPVRRMRPIPLISRPQPLGLNRGNLKHPAVKHRTNNRYQKHQTP
jgi:hypothetical protein